MLGRKKPVTSTEDLLQEVDALLVLINNTGIQLQQMRAIVQEHGGSVQDLREIISKQGDVGDAMRRAVARTRLKYPELMKDG